MTVLEIYAISLQLPKSPQQTAIFNAIKKHSREVLLCKSNVAQTLQTSLQTELTPYVSPVPLPEHTDASLLLYREHLSRLKVPWVDVNWDIDTNGHWTTVVDIQGELILGIVSNTLTGEIAISTVADSVVVDGLVGFYGILYPEPIPFLRYVAHCYPEDSNITHDAWMALSPVEQRDLLGMYP